MILLKRELPKNHKIVLISDVHIGTLSHHRKGFIQAVEMAKEPNTYLCFLGDMIDGITSRDKRFEMPNLDPTVPVPVQQYSQLLEIVEPYVDKTLVMMIGNHEYTVEQKTGIGSYMEDVVCSQLASKLNKSKEYLYGDYECTLSIVGKKGKPMYKMYFHHGFGSINSKNPDLAKREAMMLGSLKGKLEEMAGDCALMAMGHTHQLLIREPQQKLYLTTDDKDIRENYLKLNQTADYIDPELRWYINTGCFYKTKLIGKAGYSTRAGYTPNVLGFPVVHVVDGIITEVEEVLI